MGASHAGSFEQLCHIGRWGPRTSRVKGTIDRKNPHAHKNKIGTSTPPSWKKPRTPPLKGGILWAWGFSSRKNPKMPGAHKIGAAISGPRITDGNFMDATLFLNWVKSDVSPVSSKFWNTPGQIALCLHSVKPVSPQHRGHHRHLTSSNLDFTRRWTSVFSLEANYHWHRN